MKRPAPCERRLARLCKLRRPLTVDEQREVKRLAKMERANARRRARYASDPAYRADRMARALAYWQAGLS